MQNGTVEPPWLAPTPTPIKSSDVQPNAEGLYPCPECNRAFKSKHTLGRHRLAKHGVVGTSLCATTYNRKRSAKSQTASNDGTHAHFCPCCATDLDKVQAAAKGQVRFCPVDGVSIATVQAALNLARQ